MSTVKIQMSITFFRKAYNRPLSWATLIQFTSSNSISLRLILIFFCHLRFGPQNALLFSCVPNENVVGQGLCRLSLTYYTLRPLQIRWWIILLAGIIAITLYVCAAVCVGRCQLLGTKSPIGPNTAFVLMMETDLVYETFCSVRHTRQ
jgi:hypothetical protein